LPRAWWRTSQRRQARRSAGCTASGGRLTKAEAGAQANLYGVFTRGTLAFALLDREHDGMDAVFVALMVALVVVTGGLIALCAGLRPARTGAPR
jgi:hypothetical protein